MIYGCHDERLLKKLSRLAMRRKLQDRARDVADYVLAMQCIQDTVVRNAAQIAAALESNGF
jgi:hypothetical protein